MKLLTVILIAMTCLTAACSVVGPGQRGIRFWFGKASDEVASPGAYLWVPFFAGMKEIDVQVQKSEIKTTAASKDMQDITTQIAVNWKLSPEKVVTIFKNVGDEDDIQNRILVPAVSEVLKASTAKYTAEEILKERMQLKTEIDNGLKERLNAYGIDLFDVSITHLEFTAGFAKAIEEKQIAEQRAKQAVYEAEQATQDAKAEVEKAKGRAASQNLVRASITKEILQQQAIEKWDGKFPTYMGSNALPFINMKMKEE